VNTHSRKEGLPKNRIEYSTLVSKLTLEYSPWVHSISDMATLS